MKKTSLQKVKKVILSGGILLTGLLTFGFSEKASAHGYVESPASRSYLCKQGVNVNCGPVQYEPQSVEGIGGFPQLGPSDGQIAGAGHFPALDVQAGKWPAIAICPSGTLRFRRSPCSFYTLWFILNWTAIYIYPLLT